MILRRVASRLELTRLITMGLLDTTGRRSSFTSGLGGELLTGGFASGRLAYLWLLVMILDAICAAGRQKSLRSRCNGSELVTTIATTTAIMTSSARR